VKYVKKGKKSGSELDLKRYIIYSLKWVRGASFNRRWVLRDSFTSVKGNSPFIWIGGKEACETERGKKGIGKNI